MNHMVPHRACSAGPHLVELNDVLERLAATGHTRVASVVEGRPTALSPLLPAIHFVPEVGAISY